MASRRLASRNHLHGCSPDDPGLDPSGAAVAQPHQIFTQTYSSMQAFGASGTHEPRRRLPPSALQQAGMTCSAASSSRRFAEAGTLARAQRRGGSSYGLSRLHKPENTSLPPWRTLTRRLPYPITRGWTSMCLFPLIRSFVGTHPDSFTCPAGFTSSTSFTAGHFKPINGIYSLTSRTNNWRRILANQVRRDRTTRLA